MTMMAECRGEGKAPASICFPKEGLKRRVAPDAATFLGLIQRSIGPANQRFARVVLPTIAMPILIVTAGLPARPLGNRASQPFGET
jgi:hypothetical protein